MKRIGENRIPEFRSPEEEREYWEAHGPLVEGQKGRVTRPRPGQKRSSFLAVRLTGEELTRLRDVAAEQGLGPSTFARSVLMGAVGQGTVSPKRMTLKQITTALEETLPDETRVRMEGLLKAITIGEPPILFELTDQDRLEEFAHLAAAALLSIAGVQVVVPQSDEQTKAKRAVKARS